MIDASRLECRVYQKCKTITASESKSKEPDRTSPGTVGDGSLPF